MSLEHAATAIKTMIGKLIETTISEGFARAKELYVDTLDPATGKGKMPLQVLKRLAAKDPTPQKKYIEWMARIFLRQRGIRGLDSIAKFDELCNRNKIEQRDINQYKTMEEVDDAISAAFAKEETKKRAKQDLFKGQLRIDTDVLNHIDRTPNFLNPHSGDSTVDGYRVDGASEEKAVDPEKDQKEHPGTQLIKYLEGPKTGKIERVKNERIQGNPGDLFFENDMIVIVTPHDNKTSELYGRNPDPESRKAKPSYWCTSSPGQRYFQSYWNSGGKTLYYILPKRPEAVLYDPESGHTDRFSKVATVVTPSGSMEGMFDRFDTPIPDDKWKKLCKLWGISPRVAK